MLPFDSSADTCLLCSLVAPEITNSTDPLSFHLWHMLRAKHSEQPRHVFYGRVGLNPHKLLIMFIPYPILLVLELFYELLLWLYWHLSCPCLQRDLEVAGRNEQRFWRCPRSTQSYCGIIPLQEPESESHKLFENQTAAQVRCSRRLPNADDQHIGQRVVGAGLSFPPLIQIQSHHVKDICVANCIPDRGTAVTEQWYATRVVQHIVNAATKDDDLVDAGGLKMLLLLEMF